MKFDSEIARQPRDQSVQCFPLALLVSLCMAAIGCVDCSAKTSPQVNERNSIPTVLATWKRYESPMKANDGSVSWRGVDSGYCHVTNGN